MNTIRFKEKLYLLFVDIETLNKKKLNEYEKKEPSYMTAWSGGYHFAFENEVHPLTLNFIQNLHLEVIRHFKTKKGLIDFDKLGAAFPLYPPIQDNRPYISPNTTYEGLKEFINSWKKTKKHRVHYISIESKSHEIQLFTENVKDEIKIFFRQTPNWVKIEYIETEHLKIIFDALQNSAYEGIINVHPSMLELNKDLTPYEIAIEENFQIDIDVFNSKINQAKTLDEKLKAIAELCLAINQAHAWKDCNVRTTYILLNRLLHEYKLPLCILPNPNRFDCFSKTELIESIKTGQSLYLNLYNNETVTFRNEYTKEEFLLKNESCFLEEKDITKLLTMIESNLNNIDPNLLAQTFPSKDVQKKQPNPYTYFEKRNLETVLEAGEFGNDSEAWKRKQLKTEIESTNDVASASSIKFK